MRSANEFLSNDLIQQLTKHHYALFGHAAVKLCQYCKSTIRNNKQCYKSKFYGISSNRCLQMTPVVSSCNQACSFCWRPHNNVVLKEFMSAQEIINSSFKAQKKLLTGFYGALQKLDFNRLKEAEKPKHVAISLSGEPTIYPFLSELIEGYHSLGLTTFLVTNATKPKVIESLSMPTQLYYSLDAPNEKIHKLVNNPFEKNSWNNIISSLELMPSLQTRKTIRITLVKGINDILPENYAKLIQKTNADFVEVKGFMFLGFSRKRLKLENMPSYDEVKEFALKLNSFLNYFIEDESRESRVILLSSKKKKRWLDLND